MLRFERSRGPRVLGLHEFGSMPVKASKQVATKSALNPLLIICAIISLPALIALADPWFPASMRWLAGFALIVPVVAALGAYIYFMLTEPNRLQSEEFLIQQQSLAAQIVDNRTQEVIEVSAVSSALSANTSLIEGNSRG